MKKKAFSMFLAIATCVLFAGCEQEEHSQNNIPEGVISVKPTAETQEEEQEEAPMAELGGEITVSVCDARQSECLDEVILNWGQKNGVKVNVNQISSEEYWKNIDSASQNGTLPDVFVLSAVKAQDYMKDDVLLDLSSKLATSMETDMKSFYPGLSDAFNYDGRQYGVPKDVDTVALWYNKTIFDEMQVDYPDENWTWDDFSKAVSGLSNDEHWGFAIRPENTRDGYFNTIYSMDGYVIKDDMSKSGYDYANTVQAMKLFADMITMGCCPNLEQLGDKTCKELFAEGKTAMIMCRSDAFDEFCENEYIASNCDVTVLPYMNDETGRICLYDGSAWVVSANSDNPEAAWKLVEYLGTDEAQRIQAEGGLKMSAKSKLSGEWNNTACGFNYNAYNIMMNDNSVFFPYTGRIPAWEDLMVEQFKGAWSGDRAIEDVCIDIAYTIKDEIDENEQ